MIEAFFRVWLEKRFGPTVAASRFTNCRTVERAYGELDSLIDTDQIEAVIGELTYSSADERAGRPNPSKILINGNIRTGLATLKGAVKLYMEFRRSDGSEPSDLPATGSDDIKQPRIGLERDLQTALRARIEQLEAGLIIIDGGAERLPPLPRSTSSNMRLESISPALSATTSEARSPAP